MVEEGIRESTRQTLLTLWNVFSFFVTYADLDGWRPAPGGEAREPAHVLDRWMLGELDATVAGVTDALEGFDALGGATRLARFVDDLSNWYVRRSRPRFWKAERPRRPRHPAPRPGGDQQLLAPFCPFLADELYVALTGDVSVHLSDWPLPTGARRPGAGRRRWPRPGASWPSAGRPAPTPRSRCASRCAGRCCCTPVSRSGARRSPRSPRSSTSRRSRTSTPSRG